MLEEVEEQCNYCSVEDFFTEIVCGGKMFFRPILLQCAVVFFFFFQFYCGDLICFILSVKYSVFTFIVDLECCF